MAPEDETARTARILFVGLNYAPEPTGISPYTTGMAENLAARGWQVRVLTTYPHYPWWRVPEHYRTLPRTVTARGVNVTRLTVRVPSHPNHARRAVFELLFGLRAVCTRWGRPSVVVVVSPALISSRLAAVRARLERIPVITWVQDIYTLGVNEAGAGMGSKLIGSVERSLARASRRIVVIHPRFRRMFADDLGVARPIDVVRNWSHIPALTTDGRERMRASLGWQADETIVLHAGAMGAKQGLENVVRAAREATSRAARVRFVLLGDGSQRASLQAMGPDPSLEFIDPLPDREYYDALAAADILLVNERSGMTEMSVPSKLTSYFATGLPIIAAVDPRSTTYDEVTSANAGVCVPADDPNALLDAVQELAAHTDQARVYGASGREYRNRVLTEEAAVRAFEKTLSASLYDA